LTQRIEVNKNKVDMKVLQSSGVIQTELEVLTIL